MKTFACCVIAMLLTACGSLGGRDQFLIDAGDKPVIYAPGHGPAKDLVVDLPLSDKQWNPTCNTFKVSDRYEFTANSSGFMRKNVRLTIKDPQGWANRPATDRGQPWRVAVLKSNDEGKFALDLHARLATCIDKELLAPTMLAIMSSMPRNFDEEIVFQYGVVSKENGLPLLWAVQLRGGMQLRLTSHSIAPVDIVGNDNKRRIPFGGLSQTEFMVIERTGEGERALELASGLDLSIKQNKGEVDRSFIHYVDSGWYTREFGSSMKIPVLPTGAYIAYPEKNPRQTIDGGNYWGPEDSLMFSTMMVLDFMTRQTDENNKFSVIDLLNKLRTKRGTFCTGEVRKNVPVFCPQLAGGALVVARIRVTTNAGTSWVPVGTLVADVLQEAGWSGPLAGFACPAPVESDNTNQRNLMRAHATTLSNSFVSLPTLERLFATGLAKAIPATAEALLCAPLLPGDRLSW